MDGLLLDTERPVIDLWIKAGKKFGWDIKTETVYRTIGVDEASSQAVYREAFCPEFSYDKVRKELFRLIYEQFSDGVNLIPGALSLLDFLEKRKIPFNIDTSTDRPAAVLKLEKAGILNYFRLLTCGNDVKRGNPNPDIFLMAAKRLGFSPEDCIGFEDSTAGLIGLAAAGIRSVFIKDLLSPPNEVLATVWRQCNDLAEAAALFG